MSTRAVRVRLEVPEGISESGRERAEHRARQGAVLALWEAGEISTRRAAEELGLTYHEFLNLLAERGIPVECGPLNTTAIEDALHLAWTVNPGPIP